MKFLVLLYALDGGLVITAGTLASGADFFPDCRGKEYARPTCGDAATPSGGYCSGCGR